MTDFDIEMIRMALAEAGVEASVLARCHLTPDPDDAEHSIFSGPRSLPHLWRLKAIRLVRLRAYGAAFPVVCDRHATISSPDDWNRCHRVPVGDVLLGRTCDVMP